MQTIESMKISIIIPVYNTKDYLNRCFCSVQRQSHSNFEVIIIDDGSTDGSAEICKKICGEDGRFRYFYQENQGVSSARNYGITLAHGDVVTFIDSDDWVENNMYEKMLAQMSKDQSDMVMCDAVIWEDEKDRQIDTIKEIRETCLLENNDISASILFQLAGSVWKCIYARKIIAKNEIGFPTGLKLSEDRVFNIYCIGYSKKISYLKDGLYYRYIRNGSAVHQRHDDMDKIALFAYREIIRALKETGFTFSKFLYDEEFLGTCYKAIDEIGYRDNKVVFLEKYNRIRSFCHTEEVRKALLQTKHKNPKCKLMKHHMYLLLTVVSIIKSKCVLH